MTINRISTNNGDTNPHNNNKVNNRIIGVIDQEEVNVMAAVN